MNRNEKGLELMNLVFGEEQVQNIEKNVHDISPPFLDFLKGTFSVLSQKFSRMLTIVRQTSEF